MYGQKQQEWKRKASVAYKKTRRITTTIEPPYADDHRWPSTIATIRPPSQIKKKPHPSMASGHFFSPSPALLSLSLHFPSQIRRPIAAINDVEPLVPSSVPQSLQSLRAPNCPAPFQGDATCTLVAAGLRSLAFRLILFDTLSSWYL